MHKPGRILVVRLGAMGDIFHTLPAVSSLRLSFPEAEITWIVADKWADLLSGNPAVNTVIRFARRSMSDLNRSWKALRVIKPDLAIDFQGLLQSALVARAAWPKVLFGLSRESAREPLAALLYSKTVKPSAAHIVHRNIELAAAAGADRIGHDVWIPQGTEEGALPSGPFVLAHPFAGWTSKQWPLERYQQLAVLLELEGLSLVANVPPHRATELAHLSQVKVHTSSLNGLIYATRRSSAVLGLDSGPLHLAAALQKPGVALFGPTDPARNGPYGGSISVLRAPDAHTTYKRVKEIDASMYALGVEQVHSALREVLEKTKQST